MSILVKRRSLGRTTVMRLDNCDGGRDEEREGSQRCGTVVKGDGVAERRLWEDRRAIGTRLDTSSLRSQT